MFITIEGIDGCGKTTQIDLLEKYYLSQNKEVVRLREPGGVPLSEAIRDLLLNSKDNISPIAELMLFNAARANLVEQVIKPAISEGKIVICDRFYDSTTAYQGYGRGLPLESVVSCNMLATAGLKPDVTFFIDIPLEISNSRTKNKIADRMESSGNIFFNRVIEGFREISASEPDRVIRLDGNNSIQDTFNLIKKYLERNK